ncbi:Rv3654c family TadE-like protein [Yinghuangia seranimata]|uniref:Rv3654c family TadE-like protein n=1 Tax=Yinghuangia seranimata TaxID=408067 RepID=UPI00248ABBE5|nr:Rv3654c family TadE-like protein [Yinghuangia seranimata]MDI2127926.1 pilus assembly protein TadG-related protein [Yinghuangia seranimata]
MRAPRPDGAMTRRRRRCRPGGAVGAAATAVRRPDSGSATVWAAVWALVPVWAVLVVLAYGGAVGARHRAASAADAAALAAATQAGLGAAEAEACAAAGRLAERHRAVLVGCTVRSGFADVVAEVRPVRPLDRFGAARVPARAGPR